MATFLWTPDSWALFSAWEWSEIVAAGFVAIGCIGEMYWVFKKGPPKEECLKHEDFERKRTKREQLFAVVVAIGVTIELIALPHGLIESANLQIKVETLESANLVLRSNVAILELKFRPRHLSAGSQRKLFAAVHVIPKTIIDISLISQDAEASEFADDIATPLSKAGFSLIKSPLIVGSGHAYKGISIGDCRSTNSQLVAAIMDLLGSDGFESDTNSANIIGWRMQDLWGAGIMISVGQK